MNTLEDEKMQQEYRMVDRVVGALVFIIPTILLVATGVYEVVRQGLL